MAWTSYRKFLEKTKGIKPVLIAAFCKFEQKYRKATK